MRTAGIEQFGGPVRSLMLRQPRRLASDEALIEVKAAGVGSWGMPLKKPRSAGLFACARVDSNHHGP
jgi:hypothetical protein